MEQWCFCCQAIDREWFTQKTIGGVGVEPRKCWIMVRQSWDCYCSSLLLVNSMPQRKSRGARRCLGVWRRIRDHWPDMNQLWIRNGVTTWYSGHSNKSLPELVWLGPQASICPAWNLDCFAPVCIDTSKDDGSDALWEVIPHTAEWPSLQREYLCCVLFTPWILHFVKSNYACQGRIVFHNLVLLTVYTYTSYVQIIFIQVRLTEQPPELLFSFLNFNCLLAQHLFLKWNCKWNSKFHHSP